MTLGYTNIDSSINIFAASTYNDSIYNGGTYNQGSTTSNTSSGLLTNTGLDIAVIVTLSSILLLSALIVRIWKRNARSKENNNKLSS